MSAEDAIRAGDLPACLVGGNPERYRGLERLVGGWGGWLEMWWSIAWVRAQAFEREFDAEAAAEDWP
jgi:hypothetical protein